MGTEKPEPGENNLKVVENLAGPTEMRILSVGGEKNNPDIKNSSRLLRHSTKPGCEVEIYKEGARDTALQLHFKSRFFFMLSLELLVCVLDC